MGCKLTINCPELAEILHIQTMKKSFLLFLTNIIMNSMNRLLFLAAAFLLCSSSSDKQWEKTSSGIQVKLKSNAGENEQLIKIEVVNDQIIHVIATPSGKFSTQKSLSAIERPTTFKSFNIKEEKDCVVISTSKIKARISLITGQIVFTDSEDHLILKEPAGGGKKFTAVNVQGTNGYAIQQIFDSPDDEAFYGLGQHQSDEFNYKGLNEVYISIIQKFRSHLLFQTRIMESFGIIIL